MSSTRQRDTRQLRYLAGAGLAAPIVFTLGVVAVGLTWQGYSHRTQNISDLGGTAAPNALMQNVNFIVFGALVVALAIGLRRGLIGGLAPMLLGYLGLAVIVMGLTPCTPACAAGTLVDVLHSLAALTGFLAFVAATLLVWRRLRRTTGWRGFATYSLVTGLFVLVFMGAWLMAQEIDPEQLHAGLVQRLFLAAVLVWLGVTGTRLLALGGATVDPGLLPARQAEPPE